MKKRIWILPGRSNGTQGNALIKLLTSLYLGKGWSYSKTCMRIDEYKYLDVERFITNNG